MRTNHPRPVYALVASALVLLTACQNQATPPIAAASQGRSGNPTRTTSAAPSKPTPQPTRAIAPVTSVAVNGVIALAGPPIVVSFASSGKVTAVHVAPGQAVHKGDVLAELDGIALTQALQQAQQQLALKQAQINSSLAPAKQTDIDNAKAALASAWAAYDALKKGPDASTIVQALRSWNKAKNSLYSSQLKRDGTCHIVSGQTSLNDIKSAKTEPHCKRADLDVQAAQIQERIAYQQYLDAQKPATPDALAKSWAGVVQAQASLAALQNGVSNEQKQVYDLQLAQIRLTVERAQRNLAQAKLISPCSCVVQDVSLVAGATANGSITLLDTAQLKFRTTNLNELDVIKLKAGQPATIRLMAMPQAITGTVGAILPLQSGSLGALALYTVILNLNPADAKATLLPGMTGQAEINFK